MKILHLWNDTVLWEGAAGSLGAAVIKALKTDADLRDADLRDADLTGAVLTGAVLTEAVLRGAVLRDANLTGALGVRAPIVAHIDAAILAAVRRDGCKLDMQVWHNCETTHCRSGWAIHLAGIDGYALEDRIGSAAAGALIYAASRPGVNVPNFYATNDEALADLQRGAEADPLPSAEVIA